VPSFFLWHGFSFCLLSRTSSHSMPLKFKIKGCFYLYYCPLISLKHASNCYISQNMQNCMASNGVQSDDGLQAANDMLFSFYFFNFKLTKTTLFWIKTCRFSQNISFYLNKTMLF
jgi:hypothetical protein